MIQSLVILGVALQLFSSSAHAETAIDQSCSDRLTTLRGERYGLQLLSKSVFHTAAGALDHYRTTVKTEPTLRQYVAYFSVKYGTVTGYRFIVGAKDKSSATEITYYLDVAKKLVYAEQGPGTIKPIWFCN